MWKRESHIHPLRTEPWVTMLASRLQWGPALKVHADPSQPSEASSASPGFRSRNRVPHPELEPSAPRGVALPSITEKWDHVGSGLGPCL